MKSFTLKSVAVFCAFASYACGPASWNKQAEYLPAPTKEKTALESASIQEYIADIPPAKIFEKDADAVNSRLKSASVESDSERSRVTFASTKSAPERVFVLHRRAKLLKMSVNSKNAEGPAKVHMFQRQKSNWYHWIEETNQ
jgi:hypothetical protein